MSEISRNQPSEELVSGRPKTSNEAEMRHTFDSGVGDFAHCFTSAECKVEECTYKVENGSCATSGVLEYTISSGLYAMQSSYGLCRSAINFVLFLHATCLSPRG